MDLRSTDIVYVCSSNTTENGFEALRIVAPKGTVTEFTTKQTSTVFKQLGNCRDRDKRVSPLPPKQYVVTGIRDHFTSFVVFFE